MTDRELVDLAFTMLERSYVPYSNFPVGAAILCSDGTIFTGCNIEMPPMAPPYVQNAPHWSRPSVKVTVMILSGLLWWETVPITAGLVVPAVKFSMNSILI